MYIFVGFILFIGTILYISHLNAKRRTEKLRLMAEEIGFTFKYNLGENFIDEVEHFRLFSQGRGKKAFNAMDKIESGLEIMIFDYQYTTGSGKNSTTHSQSVILFKTPNLDLPAFTLRPEGFFNKVASFFGFKDINFAENEAFSKAYLLKGENEDEIRELFQPEVLELFTGMSNVNTEGAGSTLIYYEANQVQDLDELEKFIQNGLKVFNTFRVEE